jgi:hypothetical protein
MNRRSSLSIVLHSIISFIILIVFLLIANILLSSINNSTYTIIVQFFNSLLGLFLILFLVGMINSLFWNFEFPLNLIAPISGGILGWFIVSLVYKFLEFTQTFVYFDILNKILSYNISAIVFFATLIIGYLIIITEESRRADRYSREERYTREEIRKRDIKDKEMEDKRLEEKNKKSYKSEFSWEEVGDEFKKVSLNVGKAINTAFDGKKEENSKNITKKKSSKKKIKKKRK